MTQASDKHEIINQLINEDCSEVVEFGIRLRPHFTTQKEDEHAAKSDYFGKSKMIATNYAKLDKLPVKKSK